jgi:PAB-dependent poly(A)-specific ribonuclease subunit 2
MFLAGDLDPSLSPHNLVSLKSAYIRIRALVDQGVIFVGHGLKKDFQMVNLVVPPSQVNCCISSSVCSMRF